MGKINVRSPYFINLANTNLTSAKIEIEIYSGAENTSWQNAPQYTLTSTAIDEKINFEIAELIKDYISASFDGNFPTTPVTTSEATTIFVDYRVTETINTTAQTPVDVLGERAFYGYGYFEDGANPSFNNIYYLQTNNTIVKNKNETVTIPVDNTIVTTVVWKYQGTTISTISIPSQTNIQDQITYVTSDWDIDVDEVEILTGVKTTTAYIQSSEECKYTPYKLTFINKYGAYQEIWFFKNSKLAMNTEKDKYKSNILNNGTYATYNAQVRLLTKNANQRLTLNSGYYPESNNEVFKQLFLSDKVWIKYDNKTLAVNIENNNIQYKTSLTDGLINYTIDVSFAFDTINNIR